MVLVHFVTMCKYCIPRPEVCPAVSLVYLHTTRLTEREPLSAPADWFGLRETYTRTVPMMAAQYRAHPSNAIAGDIDWSYFGIEARHGFVYQREKQRGNVTQDFESRGCGIFYVLPLPGR